MLLADIDWKGLAAVIVAIPALLGAVAEFFARMRQGRELRAKDDQQQHEIDDLKRFKHDSIMRGFAGAKRLGFVTMHDSGKMMISGPQREAILEAFASRKGELQAIYKRLKRLYGRKPDEVEMALEIERTHNAWLRDFVCPVIQRESYECVALACVIAAENGSSDHKPGSWTNDTKMQPI